MTVIDTNALLRFLLNDIPLQARRVEHLLNTEGEIFIPVVVFTELDYVLRKGYNFARASIVVALRRLLALEHTSTANFVLEAIDLYSQSSLDLANCLITAEARVKNADLFTFDKKLLKAHGTIKST